MSLEASFVAPGVTTNYSPDADVDAGEVVVQNQLVGIAERAISASVQGALTHRGIFSMPKSGTSGESLAVGVKVYWDAVNRVVTSTAGQNVYVGKVAVAADEDDTSVKVRLEQ